MPKAIFRKRQLDAITARLLVVTNQDYRLERRDDDASDVLCAWVTPSHQNLVLAVRRVAFNRFHVSIGRHCGADGIETMTEASLDPTELERLANDAGQVVGVMCGQRRGLL